MHRPMWEKGGESSMPCTEAYKEHIMYTFDGLCKTGIRFLPSSAGGWDCFNQKDYQQLLIVFSIYNTKAELIT